MSDEAQGVLVFAFGLVAARLVLTGDYASYVKPGMQIPLLVAAVVLVVLGVLTLVHSNAAARARAAGASGEGDHDHPAGGHAAHDHAAHDHDAHGHGHHHTRVAWLLLLPLLILIVAAPPALGADATTTDSVRAPAQVSTPFRPIDTSNTPVEMTLGEFTSRSYWDQADSLAGVDVRLIGFVANDPPVPGGFRLTRFALACCAADAYALQVEVRSATAAPPIDTWVEVVGTWRTPPDGTTGIDRGAALDARSITAIEQPELPYE